MGTSDLPHIRKLDENVVNRIAAGEIIQRPASALKEMIENSLDAGSTQISVVVKDGGLKLLQIQDNGHGIRAEDLALLCERHATSKLREYEELQCINTLGFRGEALASISFVAHLTATTMNAGQQHGWKVGYADGVMDAAGPKPCAALPGTTILVEDMFYNVPTRKKALKNLSEEYARILDIIGRYAVYAEGVGFTCKRQGESRSDLHTLPTASQVDNIRAVYGSAVAKNLHPFVCQVGPEPGTVQLDDDVVSIRAKGYMSGPDYQSRKSMLVLFINGRPVECAPLKRAIETTYAAVLPKTQKPWVMLDVVLPSFHVDVNLHPTKREVGFLHQDDVISAIRDTLEQQLSVGNTTRTFTQSLLPGVTLLPDAEQNRAEAARKPRDVPEYKLVRTDSKAQKLQTLIGSQQQALEEQHDGGTPPQDGAAVPSVGSGAAARALHAVPRKRGAAARGGAAALRGEAARVSSQPCTQLSSVQQLIAQVEEESHDGLTDILRNHTFIGVADDTFALLQHRTRMYLINIRNMVQDMMYQQVLVRFEHFKRISISPPISISQLMMEALEDSSKLGRWEGDDDRKAEVAGLMQQMMVQKRDMLCEYWAIVVDEQGNLSAIPQVIDQYSPDLNRLPEFVLRLGRDVDWEEESACFKTVAQVLSSFYGAPPLLCELVHDEGDDIIPEGISPLSRAAATDCWKKWCWTLEHVLFPAMRLFLKPSRVRANDGSAIEVTRLETLYRIFERC